METKASLANLLLEVPVKWLDVKSPYTPKKIPQHALKSVHITDEPAHNRRFGRDTKISAKHNKQDVAITRRKNLTNALL